MINVEELVQAVDIRVLRNSAASFASGLVEVSRASRTEIFLKSVREVMAQFGENIPDTEVGPMSVRSVYMKAGYTKTMTDTDSKRQSPESR